MLKVAIVEDDVQCAKLLQEYIQKYSEKTNVQFKCTWFQNGLNIIIDYKPQFDIIFMDIKMPHFDGMETAKELRKIDSSVAIIFVTNMLQYAIKGYEVNALDFMLKPVKYYDFEMKLIKAIDYVNNHQDASITIDMKDAKKKMLLRDIYYIEVNNHTLLYHTVYGSFSTSGQLKHMTELLTSQNFASCNSFSIVNLKHVTEVRADSIDVAGKSMPISRRRKTEFLQQLANYYGAGI